MYFFFEVKASYQLKMFHTGTAFFNMLKGLKIQQQFSLYRGLHTIILFRECRLPVIQRPGLSLMDRDKVEPRGADTTFKTTYLLLLLL